MLRLRNLKKMKQERSLNQKGDLHQRKGNGRMTIGERIAQIRKANNLSQEAFGETLGVSRQAISKWEADSSIPDVDKLMSMSRIYGVSIGYILGMDEETGSRPEESQLSETQLKMVEEIVRRYLDAAPRQGEPARGKRRYLMAAVSVTAVIFLVIFSAIGYFTNALNRMEDRVSVQNQYLQREISDISEDMKKQTSALAEEIQEILEEQGNVLAYYECTLESVDPAEKMATFCVSALPKKYVDGMRMTFMAVSEDREYYAEGTEENRRFTAKLTCKLSDEIVLWALTEGGEADEIQRMESIQGMLTKSGLKFFVCLGGYGYHEEEGKIKLTRVSFQVSVRKREAEIAEVAKVEEVKGVIYINGEEYGSYDLTPEDDDSDYKGLATLDLFLEEGDTFVYAARATDNYGRIFEEIGGEYIVVGTALKPASEADEGWQ